MYCGLRLQAARSRSAISRTPKGALRIIGKGDGAPRAVANLPLAAYG